MLGVFLYHKNTPIFFVELSKQLKIYASLSMHNGKPALVLRRVITDPEIIRMFTLALLRKERIEMPVLIMVLKKQVFASNARRLEIIKQVKKENTVPCRAPVL